MKDSLLKFKLGRGATAVLFYKLTSLKKGVTQPSQYYPSTALLNRNSSHLFDPCTAVDCGLYILDKSDSFNTN